MEDEIYQRYKDTAYKVAYRFLRDIGSRQDIEDCMNEAFVWLIENEDKYDVTRGNIEQYIYVITRSKALNLRKKLQKAKSRLQENLEEQVEWLPINEDIYFKEVIKSILGELRVEERKLFTMRFIYYYEIEEIAKALKVSRIAIDMRLMRLRKKLHKLFLKYDVQLEQLEGRGSK